MVRFGRRRSKMQFSKAVDESELEEIKTKLEMQHGDISLIVADKIWKNAVVALGALRCRLAAKLNCTNPRFCVFVGRRFSVVRIFRGRGTVCGYASSFHSSQNEDLPFMLSDPSRVRAKAYDVINGDEIGGGSMRIYNREVQKRCSKLLGFTDEQIARDSVSLSTRLNTVRLLTAGSP